MKPPSYQIVMANNVMILAFTIGQDCYTGKEDNQFQSFSKDHPCFQRNNFGCGV